jgi:iron complex outermembrane receptor protein
MKRQLFASACLIFISAGANAALAQQASVPPPASAGVTDVVVTAEHRTQSVQKASLAIDVVTPTVIKNAGVTQVRDLQTVVPGLIIGQGGPATQIYIRGIGDLGSTPTTNPGVATYIDGVYVARSNAIEGNFYDLSRIEVLKGPQGTLYGRNTAGGALNILTNPPVLTQESGDMNVEIGNYGEFNTDGMLNLPVSDTLAVRGAFQIISRDGYSSEGFDDDHQESGRLEVLWKPTDKFSLRVGGAYTHVGGMGPGFDLDTLNFPNAISSQLAQISEVGSTSGNPSLTNPTVPLGSITIPTNPRLSITDPRVSNVVYGISLLQALEETINNHFSPGVVGPFNGTSYKGYCLSQPLQANNAKVGGVAMHLTGQVPGLCNATLNGVGLLTSLGPFGTATPYVESWDQGAWQAFAGQNNRYWNLNAQMDWDLGFANLTVIPAYRHTDMSYATFPTAVFDDEKETSDEETLEVRLARDTRLVNWTLGGYIFNEDQGLNSQQFAGFLFNTINPETIKTTNYALFGQGTWHITDQFRVITGIRYSDETRALRGESAYIFPEEFFTGFPPPNGLPCFNSATTTCIYDKFSGSITSQSVNYKVGLEYDLSPRNMLYFTVATGTKAGGLNPASIGFPTNDTPIPYKPETVNAFEFGSKNQFFDRRLQVNIEGFYWIYLDHQENATFVSPSGAFVPSTVNAGSADLYGFDLSVVGRATDNDTLTFDVEYNHSEYTNFEFNSANLLPGIDTDCKITVLDAKNDQRVNCKRFPLAQAPLWSGSVGWTHVFNLSNGGHLDATATAQFSDRRYLSNQYNPQVLAPAYVVGNLYATYYSPNGKWNVGAFVRNLSDTVTYQGAFSIRGLNSGLRAVNVGAPRTFGGRIGVNF